MDGIASNRTEFDNVLERLHRDTEFKALYLNDRHSALSQYELTDEEVASLSSFDMDEYVMSVEQGLTSVRHKENKFAAS